jgi:hypothetical protein
VCLLWLWADSQTHVSGWDRCPSPVKRYTISARTSALHFSRYTQVSDHHEGSEDKGPLPPHGWKVNAPWGGLDRVMFRPHGHVSFRLLFPSPMSGSEELEGINDWRRREEWWIFPIWILVAAWLPLWLPLTWWQARRRRKKLQPGAAVDGDREIAG